MLKSAITVFALMGLFSARAGATLIISQITGGSASLSGGVGSFALTGPNASFSGTGPSTSGPCTYLPCSPGSTQGGTSFSSEDRGLSGAVAAGGVSFTYVASPGSPWGGGVDFNFGFTIPNFGAVAPDALTFTVPFTASGGFNSPPNLPPFDPQGFTLLVNGAGIATINLHRLSSPSVAPQYGLQSAEFAFVAVPEPSGVRFTAFGLLGLSLALLKRGYLSS